MLQGSNRQTTSRIKCNTQILQEIELLKQQDNGQLNSLVVLHGHGDWNTIMLSLQIFWQGDG
jgi:hypothetical protein